MNLFGALIVFAASVAINTPSFGVAVDPDIGKNYPEFLNFGDKKIKTGLGNRSGQENAVLKSKVEVLGEIFKDRVDDIKAKNKKLDLIFLIDASSSIGEGNFQNELKFVKKLLSDIVVDYNHSRVAIVTFSSSDKIIKTIDEISHPREENNKCLLLKTLLEKTKYSGGGTYTLGAFKIAQAIFKRSRQESKKVLFLVTDGFSNGGDPIPIAKKLKENKVTVFTIGIRNGNYNELYQLSSSPGEYYSYLLDSFGEFESLARRALHVDLQTGDYIPLGRSTPCDFLCKEGNCCDKKAYCSCGTSTGHYSCICQPGYYGSGLVNDCLPCPAGSFGNGPNLCLPCPDVNHIAETGSESCKCKTGYHSTKENRCEVITCSELSPPEHGYFVKSNACAYVFNSACGVRCEVGYTMEGSSIRLCQSNATWSGQIPTCQIRTCEALTTPAHGTMVCQHFDLGETYTNETELPVDTACSFACERGRTLMGSRQRTCLPLAQWDGLRTSCKQVKCNKLTKIQFGQIEPSSCLYGKQAFGKTCKFTCDEGFEMVGPREKHCTGLHGTWTGKRETKCKDVTKPLVICPENIKESTLPGKNYGQVFWTMPIPTDNSGFNVTVWTKPSIKDVANFKFKIGTTNVTYFAQDMFKNTAKCHFIVEIYDDESPTIEDCVDPPPFLSSEKSGTDIVWDEPNIFDNSQNVKITKTHEFGFFKTGTTQVTYTATDLSGNTNTCTLNITIEESFCEPLPDPVFGRSECGNSEDGVKCVITCLEGYAVPIIGQTESLDAENGSTQFVCDNENPFWYNYESQVFPECTITELPVEISEDVSIDLEPDDVAEICKNQSRLTQLSYNSKHDIDENLDEVCNDIECDLGAEAICEDYKSELEEASNLVKRQAVRMTTKRPRKGRKQRRKRKRIEVHVKIDAKTDQENKRNKLLAIKDKISTIRTLDGNNVTKIRFKQSKIKCSSGNVRKKLRCVRCPLGTFHNESRNSCQSCKTGYYNDQFAQTACVSCPSNYSTRRTHAKSINDCIEQCGPGSFARKRKVKPPKKHPNAVIERITLKPHCRSCPVGTYQPLYGRLGCFKCPNGYTTSGVGSISIQDCIPTLQLTCSNSSNICNQGQCVIINDVYYSCECGQHYVGSHCETKLNSCSYSPCANGGSCTTNPEGDVFSCECPTGFTGERCETPEDDCGLACRNGGACMQDENGDFCLCPKGYHGENCQHKTRYCVANICENGGQCIEEDDTFRCICFHGYLGRRCTHLPCDFRPCPKNSICENINTANPTRDNYKCICEDGYMGVNCTQKIDPCWKNECSNGGVCKVSRDRSYVCECRPNFYGQFCQRKAEDRFVLVFTRAGVTDSVRLDGFTSNLTKISICLWIQTLDTQNYGTILSYATFKYDNTFTITDYGGLVFYINNKKIYSDIILNDGFWHYFCFTWDSRDGSYLIYVDGTVIQQGLNFAQEEVLEAYGKMVIGQEQDIMGGRFSQSEAFLGKITHFDVWDKTLSPKEISDQMHDCFNERFGNVYSWPDMRENVFGKVKVETSDFCSECKKSPSGKIRNGHVEILNNTAYYRCDKGYTLSDDKYASGRRCNKAGEWEGHLDPYCNVLFCHYPGYLRHGSIYGRKYSYLSQIHYSCNTGYTMKGNDTRICGENGVWEPQAPICLGLRCKAFDAPENGKIIISSDYSDEYREDLESYDVGTSIEIICDEDCKMNGEPVITCEVTGEWDNEMPECIREKPKFPCSLDHIPAAPANGYITEESRVLVNNFSSNVIEFKCRDGYRLVGDNMTTCILDGYWTQPNITCELIAVTVKCPGPPKVRYAKLLNSDKVEYVAGDTVTYECIEGYRLLGNGFAKCGNNGRWSRVAGKCIKKTCGKPAVAESTVVEGKSYLFGEKVKIICGNGKEYILMCESSGKWSSIPDSSC